MTVHTVSSGISNISDIGSSSCNLRRIRSVRERLDTELDHVGDLIGVVDNYLHRLFFTEILEFIEHLVCRSEIQVTLHLGVTEAHAHEHILSVASVFFIKEVRVCRSTAHHAMIVSSLYKKFVDNLYIRFSHRDRSGIRLCRILP